MATIAVIDDVAVNRALLVTVLKAIGHETVEAADGAAGLALVRQTRPAMIICDVLMPVVDGYEFVRRLRTDPAVSDIPVVFYTAYYQESDARQLALTCGVVEVLTKPCEPEQIIATVERTLAQPAPELAIPAEFDRRHLRLMTDKLSEKVAELQAANRKLGNLIELGLHLASQRELPVLLDEFCRGACILLDADVASLAVSDPRDSGQMLSSHWGIAEATVLGPLSQEAGLLGQMLRDRLPLRRVFAEGEAASLGLPPGYPAVAAVVAAPIASLSAVYGWICLANLPSDEAPFSEEDETLLSILAAQAGRIFENDILYDRIDRHAQDLERTQRHLAAQNAVAAILAVAETFVEAAPKVLESVCGNLGFAAAALWSVDEETRQMRCLDAWPEADERFQGFVAAARRMVLAPGVSLVGQVWASGTATRVADLSQVAEYRRRELAVAAGLRGLAALPILSRGRVVGVVEFLRSEAGAIDDSLFDALRAVADQMSQFFVRSAQHGRILRLSRVYAFLSGINTAIVRIHDRLLLFQEACRIAVEEGGFGLAWIGELAAASGPLALLAWAGDGLPATLVPAIGGEGEAGAGAVGHVIQRGVPVYVNDLAGDSDEGWRGQEALRRGFHSMIALPLAVESRVVSVLCLYARERGFFTGEELKLLRELAGDISFALEFIGKQDQLVYLSQYDPLTGLANRSSWLDGLAHALVQARHEHCKVAVVTCDLGRFIRGVNDTYGRQMGDALLRQLAQRIRAAWPEPTAVGRIGADSFSAFAGRIQEVTEIAHLLERTLQRVSGEPVSVDGMELRVSLHAGIAVFPDDGDDAETLAKHADSALNEARQKAAPYLFYRDDMTALARHTLVLENKLRRALDNGEFVLHYQPKVGAVSQRVAGLEALIRWQDPDVGLVAPAQFIPVLEETGMILAVGDWAIRQAIRDLEHWRALGLDVPRVAVNVSSLQLGQRDFVDSVRAALADGGPSAGQVDLEITESMIMAEVDQNIPKFGALRRMGLEIAIDDFGTGYSSLGYLAKLPVDAVKIDQSFIVTMTTSPESMTIVSTIISLAHAMNLKVIAEGVESEEQAKFLRLLKCDQLQGYLVSRPLPPEDCVRAPWAH